VTRIVLIATGQEQQQQQQQQQQQHQVQTQPKITEPRRCPETIFRTTFWIALKRRDLPHEGLRIFMADVIVATGARERNCHLEAWKSGHQRSQEIRNARNQEIVKPEMMKSRKRQATKSENRKIGKSRNHEVGNRRVRITRESVIKKKRNRET